MYRLLTDYFVIIIIVFYMAVSHAKETKISIRKHVQMSSQYFDWHAERAIDGDWHTRPGQCECCAATNYQTNPYLQVDLGQVYEISRIVIYGRTDGQFSGQSFEGMGIFVDSNRVHTIPTGLIFKEWIHFYDLRLLLQYGRNVTLSLFGIHKQLVICEVLVFEDKQCPNGKYGLDCDMDCGKCKDDDVCEKTFGFCPNGCSDGYYGLTCSLQKIYLLGSNEQCPDGKYGISCDLDCGKCKDFDVCEKTFGDCPNGCSDGFVGTTCSLIDIDIPSTSEYLLYFVIGLGIWFTIVTAYHYCRKKPTTQSCGDGVPSNTAAPPDQGPPPKYELVEIRPSDSVQITVYSRN